MISEAIKRSFKRGKAFNPLMKKTGNTKRVLKDWEHLELVGRRALEMDAENTNKYVSTDYKGMDPDVVAVGKNVCKALDDGVPIKDIENYVKRCIKLD